MAVIEKAISLLRVLYFKMKTLAKILLDASFPHFHKPKKHTRFKNRGKRNGLPFYSSIKHASRKRKTQSKKLIAI